MKQADKPMVRRAAGIVGWLVLGAMGGVAAQDVMLQKLPFIQVAAEDERVRVLRFASPAGGQSQMHSHPETVVVVLKGGRVRYTYPDGTQKVVELKTGEAMIRAPVTHRDEALDPVEAILVELKP